MRGRGYTLVLKREPGVLKILYDHSCITVSLAAAGTCMCTCIVTQKTIQQLYALCQLQAWQGLSEKTSSK